MVQRHNNYFAILALAVATTSSLLLGGHKSHFSPVEAAASGTSTSTPSPSYDTTTSAYRGADGYQAQSWGPFNTTDTFSTYDEETSDRDASLAHTVWGRPPPPSPFSHTAGGGPPPSRRSQGKPGPKASNPPPGVPQVDPLGPRMVNAAGLLALAVAAPAILGQKQAKTTVVEPLSPVLPLIFENVLRYSTRYDTPGAVSKEMRKKCIFNLKVSVLTDGAKDAVRLLKASVRVVEGGSWLRVKIRTLQHDGRLSLWTTLKTWVGVGTKTYEKTFLVPRGCIHTADDKYAAYTLLIQNGVLKEIRVRFTPETFALYSPSEDALSSRAFQLQVSPAPDGFMDLYDCLFFAAGASKSLVDPNSIRMLASLRSVRIEARLNGDPVVIGSMEFPCACKPVSYGHVAWWSLSTHGPGNGLHPLLYVHSGVDDPNERPYKCYERSLPEAGSTNTTVF